MNEINSFGGYFKQYQVIVSPDRLLKHGISVDQVYGAIEKNNQNAGGNIIEKHSDQYIVRGVGLIKNTADIENIVLKSHGGTPTYLKDVAEVKIGEAVRQGAAMINGKDEAVGGIVMMLRGENSREVVERVKRKVKEINENNILPKGIKIAPYYDRSDIVKASVATVTKALVEGAFLVLIVLYLLLRSFRASFVVLIALPLSLLSTFIVMKIVGLSANLMSLGGLAISIGMIVDATIIQVENVQRHLSEGGPWSWNPYDRAQGGARGEKAEHPRRADHRDHFHPHSCPGRDRREDVRPPCADGCHRPSLIPGSFDLRHSGLLLDDPESRSRKKKASSCGR